MVAVEQQGAKAGIASTNELIRQMAAYDVFSLEASSSAALVKSQRLLARRAEQLDERGGFSEQTVRKGTEEEKEKLLPIPIPQTHKKQNGSGSSSSYFLSVSGKMLKGRIVDFNGCQAVSGLRQVSEGEMIENAKYAIGAIVQALKDIGQREENGVEVHSNGKGKR